MQQAESVILKWWPVILGAVSGIVGFFVLYGEIQSNHERVETMAIAREQRVSALEGQFRTLTTGVADIAVINNRLAQLEADTSRARTSQDTINNRLLEGLGAIREEQASQRVLLQQLMRSQNGG